MPIYQWEYWDGESVYSGRIESSSDKEARRDAQFQVQCVGRTYAGGIVGIWGVTRVDADETVEPHEKDGIELLHPFERI